MNAAGRQPLIPQRLTWAAALIRQADGPIPEYGSAQFEALDDHDPRKVASCVRAAEAWRTYWSPDEIARRLRLELEAAHLAEDGPAEWSQEIVAEVHRSASRPSFAELSERRNEPEAAARGRAHQRRLGLVPVG